jgi:hypothetical protein
MPKSWKSAVSSYKSSARSMGPGGSPYVGGRYALVTDMEQLLRCEGGLDEFCSYISSQHDDENLYFFSCAELFARNETMTGEERHQQAVKMFGMFLAESAPSKVNVSEQLIEKTRGKINAGRDAKDVDKDVFVEAKDEVAKLMAYNHYKVFYKTEAYETLLPALWADSINEEPDTQTYVRALIEVKKRLAELAAAHSLDVNMHVKGLQKPLMFGAAMQQKIINPQRAAEREEKRKQAIDKKQADRKMRNSKAEEAKVGEMTDAAKAGFVATETQVEVAFIPGQE